MRAWKVTDAAGGSGSALCSRRKGRRWTTRIPGTTMHPITVRREASATSAGKVCSPHQHIPGAAKVVRDGLSCAYGGCAGGRETSCGGVRGAAGSGDGMEREKKMGR